MKRRLAIVVMLALAAALCLGQTKMGQANKKSYTLRGKVEKVDEKAKNLTVNGEEVKGWMTAMTMVYDVDDPAVLKTIKAGDQITATVYDGDLVLHKVQVQAVKKDSGKKKK